MRIAPLRPAMASLPISRSRPADALPPGQPRLLISPTKREESRTLELAG